VFLYGDDGTAPVVDNRTGPGKILERILESLQIEAKIVRGPDVGPAISVLDGPTTTVCVRSDLLSAPPGELAYLFTYGLLIGRKRCLALATVPEADRPRLLTAIAAAVTDDQTVEDQAIATLAARIARELRPEELSAWRTELADIASRKAELTRVFGAIEQAASRVALVAAGDLRTASRAVARIAADPKRPPGVARLEDFEVFFASIPALGPLFRFASSDEFGAIIGASG
jgi:hypothetical protein